MTQVETMQSLLPTDTINELAQSIDSQAEELNRLNLEIHSNPEILFQEVKACKLLSDWFEARGWSVKRGVYGIDTAFEARFSVKEGGRTVCFNAEYDALPGIGHACGHNLIATSTIASAVGVEAIMKSHNIAGTVVVMGTPAEESGGGKWIMANNGAWKGMDACVMTHPMHQFSTPLANTLASWKIRAKFYGKQAHASAAPWTGINACDAIVHAYNGIALLRQQVHRTESIQGVILEAGKAANVIPQYSEGVFSVRAPTMKQLSVLRNRVEPIFHAAASATGCKLELEWTALYEDVVTNRALADQYRAYMLQHLGLTPEKLLTIEETKAQHDQTGSSDFGSCSYICPGIQAMFNINAEDLPHSVKFCEAAGKEFGFREALRAGKANALILLDVLTNDEFAAKMKQEFKEAMIEAGRWEGDV